MVFEFAQKCAGFSCERLHAGNELLSVATRQAAHALITPDIHGTTTGAVG